MYKLLAYKLDESLKRTASILIRKITQQALLLIKNGLPCYHAIVYCLLQAFNQMGVQAVDGHFLQKIILFSIC